MQTGILITPNPALEATHPVPRGPGVPTQLAQLFNISQAAPCVSGSRESSPTQPKLAVRTVPPSIAFSEEEPMVTVEGKGTILQWRQSYAFSSDQLSLLPKLTRDIFLLEVPTPLSQRDPSPGMPSAET